MKLSNSIDKKQTLRKSRWNFCSFLINKKKKVTRQHFMVWVVCWIKIKVWHFIV